VYECGPILAVKNYVTCVLYGGRNFYGLRSTKEVENETRLRAQFVEHRLGHRPAGIEGMDLTEFMHGGPAEVLSCARREFEADGAAHAPWIEVVGRAV